MNTLELDAGSYISSFTHTSEVAESANGTEKALDLGVQSAAKEASLLLGRLRGPEEASAAKGSFPSSGGLAGYRPIS
jgi:hypothetical protein